MEASNLIPDVLKAWSAYIATFYAFTGWLCIAKLPRWLSIFGATLFASQAIDQLTGGNLFSDGFWEYPVAAVAAAAIYYLTKR